MNTRLFSHGDSTICIHLAGSGPVPLLAFHGYGQTGAAFAALEPHLPRDCTLIAPDLPFHGATEWKGEKAISTNGLVALADSVVAAAGLGGHRKLLGYSMGGRVAACLLHAEAPRFSKAVFVAPEGLAGTRVYRFITGTTVGEKLFRYNLRHPAFLQGMVRALDQARMVFFSSFLRSEESREQLYRRWMALRNLLPDPVALAGLIRVTGIPVELVYGEKDRVIPAQEGNRLIAACPGLVHRTLLPCGHQMLTEKNAVAIAGLL